MSKEYDEYLNNHRSAVSECHALLTGNILYLRDGNNKPYGHDASKYSKEEYEAYDEYFYPSDGSKVGEDPKRKKAFDKAWLHHQNCNSHHWQYHVLINDEEKMKALEMPLKDVYEMVADWGAFAYLKKDGQHLRDWYKINRDRQIIHEKTREIVDALVVVLAAKIDEVFKEEL